jgi:hypothetical protein
MSQPASLRFGRLRIGVPSSLRAEGGRGFVRTRRPKRSEARYPGSISGGRFAEPGGRRRAPGRSAVHPPVRHRPGRGSILPQTNPAAQKNVEKLVESGILMDRAGTSNPKVFVAGEILRRLDEPLTETPTTR